MGQSFNLGDSPIFTIVHHTSETNVDTERSWGECELRPSTRRNSKYFKKDVERIKYAFTDTNPPTAIIDFLVCYVSCTSDIGVPAQLSFVADGASSFEKHQHDKIACWMSYLLLERLLSAEWALGLNFGRASLITCIGSGFDSSGACLCPSSTRRCTRCLLTITQCTDH